MFGLGAGEIAILVVPALVVLVVVLVVLWLVLR